VNDKYYFFEDRPPTPVFVPDKPRRDFSTQIEDGELFDYDLEVEPILEVLVGRSLLQARYELIEDDERKDYLMHKKKYEQKREFELVNLQRTEAAHIRREEERKRRNIQKVEKAKYDNTIHKKLYSKLFAKSYFKDLKKTSLSNLSERGYLKDHLNYQMIFYIKDDYYPLSTLIHTQTDELPNILSRISNERNGVLAYKHKNVIDIEKERIKKIRENKELAKRVNFKLYVNTNRKQLKMKKLEFVYNWRGEKLEEKNELQVKK
jgi:hypothetical protein